MENVLSTVSIVKRIITRLLLTVSTRPADGVEAPPTLPPRGDLIFDKEQAWDHYQKFIKVRFNLKVLFVRGLELHSLHDTGREEAASA